MEFGPWSIINNKSGRILKSASQTVSRLSPESTTIIFLPYFQVLDNFIKRNLPLIFGWRLHIQKVWIYRFIDMKLKGNKPKLNSYYDLEIVLSVYQFERAAITKYSQTEWLKQQNVLSHSSGSQNSMIKLSTGLHSF